MPKIKNNDNTKCWLGSRAPGTFIHFIYENEEMVPTL